MPQRSSHLGQKDLDACVLPAHDLSQEEQRKSLQAVFHKGQIVQSNLFVGVVGTPTAHRHLVILLSDVFESRFAHVSRHAAVHADPQALAHPVTRLHEYGAPPLEDVIWVVSDFGQVAVQGDGEFEVFQPSARFEGCVRLVVESRPVADATV